MKNKLSIRLSILLLIFILLISQETIRVIFAVGILSIIILAFISGRVMWLYEVYYKYYPPKNDDVLDDEMIDDDL